MFFNLKKSFRDRGSSLIEVLVALAIITVAISGSVFLLSQGQVSGVDTAQRESALYLAQNNLESARKAARDDFDSLVSIAPATTNGFTTETVVTNVNTSAKKILSRTSWDVTPGGVQKVELTTIVTDWQNACPDPNDCGGGGTTGDWRNPRTLGTIDLGPGNSATDIDVVNKIVYLSASASAAAKPDFFIINATNGSNPFIASSINTGSSLNAIDVSNGYAYVAQDDPATQLQIIDTSNLSSPVLKKSFALLGVSGPGAVGNTIFYGYGKVFIGTKKAIGPEFHIIDVTSPLNPVELGSIEINADVNSIYVNGRYAYLATSDTQELKIYDVNSPALPVKVGGYDAPGSTEYGKVVWYLKKTLFLGRLKGGNVSTNHEFHIFDIDDPINPDNLGSKNFIADINDMRARDDLAFIGTSDSNAEFQVWNITNPGNISFWSSFNFPQVASGIDFEDNLVYVAVRSNDALRIITSGP